MVGGRRPEAIDAQRFVQQSAKVKSVCGRNVLRMIQRDRAFRKRPRRSPVILALQMGNDVVGVDSRRRESQPANIDRLDIDNQVALWRQYTWPGGKTNQRFPVRNIKRNGLALAERLFAFRKQCGSHRGGVLPPRFKRSLQSKHGCLRIRHSVDTKRNILDNRTDLDLGHRLLPVKIFREVQPHADVLVEFRLVDCGTQQRKHHAHVQKTRHGLV